MCLRNFIQITLALTVIVSSYANGTKRQIKCIVYPDLKVTENKNNLNLIHVKASSDQDDIHYLWSSHNLPSVIVYRTTKDTKLSLNLEKLELFQNGAITFSKEPLAVTGFTISELWQIFYASDTSDISDISSVIPLNLQSFHWKNVTNSTISCSNEFAVINFVSSTDDEIFSKGGTFEIQFSVSGIEESAAEYPHLIYTGNSTQLKVVFSNLYSNSSRVRYGMEMAVFAPLTTKCSDNDHCETVITKSVSDEFSPGIFSDVTLLPRCSTDSFLSWRPVAYLSNEPSVANSTDAKVTAKCSISTFSSPRSIAELFFNDRVNVSANVFNMTFGTKGDGFYPKTEYIMWSVMAGVGTSVGFKLSATAIIIAIVGMGALLLFITSGLIFIGVQRCRRKEDELLLDTNNVN